MARSHQLISAPSIYLFAFQQQQEFFAKSSLKRLSPEWSTRKYSQILNHFFVCQKIKLNSRANRHNLVYQHKNNLQSITEVQKFLGTIKNQGNLELINGEAYPCRIDNSHVISLRINRLEKNADQAVSVNNLAYFNPKNCFSPHNVKTNLGQTVVITALVNNRENIQPESLQSLANSCLSSFAHLASSLQKTVLIDSSIISNGCVFTYYLPGNLRQYNQIIVGLFFRQEDLDNFQKHHQQLSKFFLSFHKLTYVHQHSSSLLKLACYQMGQLKYHLKTSSSNDLSQVPSPNNLETKYSPISGHNRIDRYGDKSSLSEINKKPMAVLN